MNKKTKCRHKFLVCEKPKELVTWDGPYHTSHVVVIKYHKCVKCGKEVGG